MKSIRLFLFVLIVSAVIYGSVIRGQFSHPVVVLKGIVRSEDNMSPISVRVSAHIAGDTAKEITSISNKITGKYLFVLKPEKSYWIHLEGDSILSKDVLISTPKIDHTQQIDQDFFVVTREIK